MQQHIQIQPHVLQRHIMAATSGTVFQQQQQHVQQATNVVCGVATEMSPAVVTLVQQYLTK